MIGFLVEFCKLVISECYVDNGFIRVLSDKQRSLVNDASLL
jgi:hypothetical protein